MTRLGRMYAAFRQTWNLLPLEEKAEFEARVSQAADALKYIAEKSSDEFRWQFLDVLGETVITGGVGIGGVEKVKLSIVEGFPELWEKIGPLIESATKED